MAVTFPPACLACLLASPFLLPSIISAPNPTESSCWPTPTPACSCQDTEHPEEMHFPGKPTRTGQAKRHWNKTSEASEHPLKTRVQWCVSLRWHPKIQAPGDTCQLMSWAEPSKQLSAQECRNLHIPKARTTTCDSRTTLLIISPCRCRLDFPGPLPPGTPGLMKQWLLISHSRTSMFLATCSLIRKHTSSESYSLCLWGPPSTSRAVVCGSWGGV